MITPYPKNIILSHTTVCSYKCIFCATTQQFGPGKLTPIFLSFDKIKDIFQNFTEVEQADMGGSGELLLHPNFNEIIKLLTDKKIPFNFSTNGEHLTNEKQKILKESPLKYINFSLNSLISETKNILTDNTGNFDKVMEHFVNFVAKPRNYEVHISMVVNRYNFKEMPDFVRFGIKHGVDRIGFFGLSPQLLYPEGLSLFGDEEELSYFKKMKELIKENNIKVNDYIGMNRDQNNKQIKRPIKECTMPWSHVGITPNGKVTVCCYVPLKMGDLNEESFYDIWNGERANELRKAVAAGDNKFCKNCGLFE
jgi:MoaA/NifB/PqqE/SkfB family radical SAM enzyme